MSSVGRTHWEIEFDATLRRVSVSVESTDPAVIAAVEEAAVRNGLTIRRLLDGLAPAVHEGEDEHDRDADQGEGPE